MCPPDFTKISSFSYVLFEKASISLFQSVKLPSWTISIPPKKKYDAGHVPYELVYLNRVRKPRKDCHATD